ncbi:MAG: DUF3078 domain-containing protein [Bacteroidota bacterium]
MKKILLFIFIFSMFNFTIAQEADSTLNKWTPSLIASLNLSQIAFQDWTKGGEDAFSFTAGVDWIMNYKASKWSFKNQLKGEWGQSKQGTDIKKITVNNAFNETVFFYDPGWIFKPYASNLIRTPITDGFDYGIPDVEKEQIVAFFDPGYITQSIGLAYDESEIIKTRLGVAFEESFSNKFAAQYTDDAETAELETFKYETGIESVTDLNLTIDDNVVYKSKLRLFSGFNRLDVWDVAWDNTFTAEVNSWLNVNLSFILIHKVSESLRTQMQEALQVGIVYNIY